MNTELTTPLCRLRAPRRSDARAIFSHYASDPEVTRYMLWPTHRSEATTRAFLAEAIARNRNDTEWTWSVMHNNTDECIGMIGVVPDAHRGEIGYVLGRRFWGHGLMTQAARAVMRWCFDDARLMRVWATCAVPNAASARVLEKTGMRREGILRAWHVFPNVANEPQDCYVYARLASDD